MDHRKKQHKVDLFDEHLAEVFTHSQGKTNHAMNNVDHVRSENITSVIPRKASNTIKTNLNQKEAPGFYLTTEDILKHLVTGTNCMTHLHCKT